LADPGKLLSLSIDSGRAAEQEFVLAGPDAREQLVVSGSYESGQLRDLTHRVLYDTEPGDVVLVDETGLVTPLRDGEVTITARSDDGIAGSITARVAHFSDQ